MKNSYLIPDMFRICPQTGEVLEEQARLRTVTDWPDEASDMVSPRNAYISFQVIVRLGSADLSEIRIEADVVAGQHDRIACEEFVYFTQWYHKVKGRYYLDALVPLGDEAQSFAAVSRRNAVPSQAFAAVWVDLFIPADTQAGDYLGAIRVRPAPTRKPMNSGSRFSRRPFRTSRL
ncbi:MAG: hypothetical protein K0Q73_3838 [Paenibacillus sp.]|nr:hypothetical protein [Paenibacillus sp.]